MTFSHHVYIAPIINYSLFKILMVTCRLHVKLLELYTIKHTPTNTTFWRPQLNQRQYCNIERYKHPFTHAGHWRQECLAQGHNTLIQTGLEPTIYGLWDECLILLATSSIIILYRRKNPFSFWVMHTQHRIVCMNTKPIRSSRDTATHSLFTSIARVAFKL